MTGLEPETDHILEIACIITDGNLDVISEGPNLVIHQPDDILNKMNEWCRVQHGTVRIQNSYNVNIFIIMHG